jgi:hypothetical protein
VPAALHLLDQPLGRVRGKRRVGRGAQGDPGGDPGQRRQIQLVGPQLALRRRAPLGLRVGHLHVAARPAQAVGRAELQALRGKLEPAREQPPAEPPEHRLQRQRLQLRPQRGSDPGQRDVERAAAELAAAHVDPGAQRAATLLHRDVGQLHVLVQLGHIDARKIAIHLSHPLLPLAGVGRQQRLVKQRRQMKALAPLRRRRGIDARRVAAHLVAQHQVDLGERQWRHIALLIAPAQRAVVNDELGLRKEPVERLRVVAGRAGEIQPTDQDPPVRGAAHVQLGLVDVQLLEPELHHRARRQRGQHARQPQRHAAGGIEQGDVAQLERRDHASGLRADDADAHGHTQRPAGLHFQQRAKLVDSRHNPPVQSTPGQPQQQPCTQQQPQHPLHRNREGSEQARGEGCRFVHQASGCGRNYDPQRRHGFSAGV